MKQLLLLGDSSMAEIAFEYFTIETDFEVAAFVVDRAYRTRDYLFGIPVLPFEDIEEHCDPATHHFFAAFMYAEMNQRRERFYRAAKEKGYQPASFISRRASVWPNVMLGEHLLISPENSINPFVTIGDDVFFWDNNHIGHHTTIGDHTFISSGVVISGSCQIGSRCFFGVNATIGNNLTIGDDCLIGAGALVLHDVPPGSYVKAGTSEVVPNRPQGLYAEVER